MANDEEENEPAGPAVAPRLIGRATNSTDPGVDPRLLKAIKSAVRSSDRETRAAASAFMDQMKKPHSQVRYLSLLLIDELFMRSKLFRTLLVANFDQFLSLSVGFRRNLPLPPPASVAAALRSKSIEFLEKWNASFGIHYRQLRLGFDYLKNTLKFQFPNRLENAARLQQERREREIRSKQILLDKFEALKENYSSIKAEIRSTIDEIGECLEIVSVKEEEFTSHVSAEEEEEEYYGVEESRSLALRQLRLEALKEGEKVKENSDNKAVFDALRELYKLLVSKHVMSVQEWMSVLVRVDLMDNRARDSMLKEFIGLRNQIQAVKNRCSELGCAFDDISIKDDEEDLWEEDTIEAYKTRNSSTPEMAAEDRTDTQTSRKGKEVAPADNEDNDKHSDGNHSGPVSNRSRLLAEAPLVPWGSFLLNWDSKSRDVMANQRGLELDGHWGRVDPDAVIPADKIAELSVHCTVYKEEPTEIQPCGAPLKSGGLCQRRDLKVCPFHGPIIPRDDAGNPIEQDLQTERDVKEETSSQATDTVAGLTDVERPPDMGKEMVEQLAKQAVKNVRERDKEVKSVKRAKLAKVRQHNEAVLREAAIASTSYSEAFMGQTEASRTNVKAKKPTLASMLKKKVTTKDRIAQRLLNTRVTEASSRQLVQGEDSRYREAFPNQW